MIPRILHQTVKDKNSIRPEWQKCMQTWKDTLRPGKDLDGEGAWTFHLWDDADNEKFVRERYPQYYQLYCDLPLPINRVDMVRYLYMHAMGGLYCDADLFCLRSIEPLRSAGRIVVGEYSFHLNRFVECAFLGSVPGHPFWLEVIEVIAKTLYKPTVLELAAKQMGSLAVHTLTGPLQFGKAVKRAMKRDNNAAGIKCFPQHIFYPDAEKKPYPADSYTVHLCTGSWTPTQDRVIWNVLRRPAVIALLIALAIVLLAFVAISIWSKTRSPPSPENYNPSSQSSQSANKSFVG